MNLPLILRYALLAGLLMLAAWGTALVWPGHAHFIRHFFRELLRALL